ncbi:MAG: PAS domain-containing protein [Sedimentisphaerales bacterium]|nr:PAS domain-containing protein [Sedimentisphaerales bacterium]
MEHLKKHCGSVLFCLSILIGLWAASECSYLVFHSIAEIFSIVVACGIFVLAWNSRRFVQNHYLLFVGIAYLFVAGLDLLHTLAYKGMGVFQGFGSNLATQLWISARYIESVSLLVAAFVIRRKFKIHVVLVIYGVVVTILLASIFYWKIFPVCYVEGTGLTLFKKVSEYVICILLLLSIGVLLKRRSEFEPYVVRLLAGSIAVTIVSELAFTLYVNVEGFPNLIGHYLKIISFYLIYKAIIQTGLTRPFDLLLRDLKHSEEALKAAKENLEIEVSERTAQLRQSIEKLRETELRYRTVADFNYDWEYWENPDCSFRYVSPSCERITGYAVDEFVANPKLLTDIIVAEDMHAWKQHREQALADPQGHDLQFRIRMKDGKVRWIEHACQSVNSQGGEFLGFRASNRDITARKEAEAKLAESREALRMLAGGLLSIQEEERRRLARELHDDLTQRLAVLAIEAGKLERQLEALPGEIREKIRRMKEQIVKLSSDVHDISRQLHPSIIDDLGIRQAIQSECVNFTKREGIAVKYEPENIPPNIPRNISVCLFRIVQESLRNIAKHAKVTEAKVRLEGHGDAISLTVEDSGVGFDPAQIRGEAGLGLVSMEERTRLIQGQFQVRSQPGQGTVIQVTAKLAGD